MAEANPKPLSKDGGDPPNKRNQSTSATVTGGSPPSNHPNEISDEYEDTASSKPKKDEIKEDEIDIIEIMHDILSIEIKEDESQIGVYPCDSPYDVQGFCRFFIEVGIGNQEEWSKKMEDMKNKFNSESDPMEEVDKKEFELWKQIWGNEQKPFK